MDHLLARVGGRRVLVANVSSSPDGHGVGYGIILKRIHKVLWYAQVTGLAVFYIREAKEINSAIFRLKCDQVEILPRHGCEALWLRCVWIATAPFRAGLPRVWVQSVIARVLFVPLYATIEQSPRVPELVRRLVVRSRPLYRTLRRANTQYARRLGAAWMERMKAAERPFRRDIRYGRELPRRLYLPTAAEQEATALAAAIGIGLTDRLITVHVREPGYRAAAGLRQREWDALRNARIEAYLDAFGALVERGYKVVRLGDPTMTPVQLSGVIDLATSPHRSEWLEVWCVLRSTFFIGCDSGPSWLAFLLGVPVLTVNAVHFRDVLRPRDRMICKFARERASGRMLSIAEMLSPPYLRDGLRTDLYEHVDNTPCDIRDAVVDMLDVVGGATRLSPAQRRVNQLLIDAGRDLPHDRSGLEGIAFSRRPRGALSKGFAKRYVDRWRKEKRSKTGR